MTKELTQEQRDRKNALARERRALAKAAEHQEADLQKAAQQVLPPSTEIPAPANAGAQPQPESQMTPEQVKAAVRRHYAAQGAVERGVTQGAADALEAPKPPAAQEPLYLVSRLDKTVYSNPRHPASRGQLVKVGLLIETKGPDGQLTQNIVPQGREPANKKERIKAKRGLPFRDKKGVVA